MKLKVRKSNIHEGFIVNKYLPANYWDAFECIVPISEEVTPDDLLIAFWKMEVGWVKSLFKLRNVLVKPLGLKSADKDKASNFGDFIKQGGGNNNASITDRSPNEMVMALSDKHLRAYLSVSVAESDNDLKRITLSTVVHFHNRLGYVYFYAIKPFHVLVVKALLRNSIKQLLNS